MQQWSLKIKPEIQLKQTWTCKFSFVQRWKNDFLSGILTKKLLRTEAMHQKYECQSEFSDKLILSVQSEIIYIQNFQNIFQLIMELNYSCVDSFYTAWRKCACRNRRFPIQHILVSYVMAFV